MTFLCSQSVLVQTAVRRNRQACFVQALEDKLGPNIVEGAAKIVSQKTALESLCRALQTKKQKLLSESKTVGEDDPSASDKLEIDAGLQAEQHPM